MKKPMSLRLRLTLLCAALLTLCCLLLTLTSNLSAVQMADAMQAVPVLPAQAAGTASDAGLPMTPLEVSNTVRQARGVFHLQSLLAMAAVLAAGLFLIYRLVGKVLAPLDELAGQIRGRTAEDLERPLAVPDSGDEVAELARAFNQMSGRLNQVFVMQKNFSHNAAHEFRTPLAVLKTRIGLFRKKRDFRPEAVQDFLQIMEGEVDRLSAMVSSLLELTNLEQMERGERLSAEQLIQGAADELALPVAERQISVLVDASPCTLTGNERLLHRAVFNLLENAVKYSPTGGSVHVAGRQADGVFRMEVTDQGPGIPTDTAAPSAWRRLHLGAAGSCWSCPWGPGGRMLEARYPAGGATVSASLLLKPGEPLSLSHDIRRRTAGQELSFGPEASVWFRIAAAGQIKRKEKRCMYGEHSMPPLRRTRHAPGLPVGVRLLRRFWQHFFPPAVGEGEAGAGPRLFCADYGHCDSDLPGGGSALLPCLHRAGGSGSILLLPRCAGGHGPSVGSGTE